LNPYAYPENPVGAVDPLGLQEYMCKNAGIPAWCPPKPPPEPKKGEVYICKRPVDVSFIPNALAKVLPEHTWVMTSSKEAGLGGDCPIPGQGCADVPYVTQTKVVSHAGQSKQPGAECFLAKDVDAECVNKKLSSTASHGTWTATNQCKTFVHDTLTGCSTKSNDGALDSASRLYDVYIK
jgi:hypothetical protein